MCEIKTLSKIALDQPQAAYAAFTHGVRSRWNYLMRTMPEIDIQLQSLEDAIRLEFIPALTGQSHLSDELHVQPPCPTDQDRGGGLGLNNPVWEADIQFQTSVNVTAPLVRLVLQQSTPLKLWQSSQRSRAKYAKRNNVSLHLLKFQFMRHYQTHLRGQKSWQVKRVPPAGSQPFP